MTKATGTTYHTHAAKLIRAYAEWIKAEVLGEDEHDSLANAVLEAPHEFVTCKIGEAMLLRNQALSDPGDRFGGEYFDPRLAKIAEALNWSA